MSISIESKRIVVLCDTPLKVTHIKKLFEQISTVRIETVMNVQELSAMIKALVPDGVLIYSDRKQSRFIEDLKHLRGDSTMDHIPILVFNELPNPKTIIDLLM